MLDEVVVGQRHPLELERDIEQGVATGNRQHVVGDLLDDARPGVVGLVDPVPEPHQAHLARPHPPHVLGHAADGANLLEHP